MVAKILDFRLKLHAISLISASETWYITEKTNTSLFV